MQWKQHAQPVSRKLFQQLSLYYTSRASYSGALKPNDRARRHARRTPRSRAQLCPKLGPKFRPNKCPGNRQRALRHSPSRSALVPPHPNPNHCCRGLQCDSHFRTHVALRSPWLAKRRARPRRRQALHLGFLAPHHHSHRLVAPQSRRGGHEHDGLRRPVDAQGNRMAGLRHRAGKFFSRRPPRARGHGEAPGRRRGLRVHHRRPARPTLHRQARSCHVSQKNRLPRPRLSYRRQPRQNLRKNLGPFSLASPVYPRRNSLRPANLRTRRR